MPEKEGRLVLASDVGSGLQGPDRRQGCGCVSQRGRVDFYEYKLTDHSLVAGNFAMFVR